MSGAFPPPAAALRNQMTAFLNFCRLEKGLAANSIEAYTIDLAKFITFLDASGPVSSWPGEEGLRNYIDYLHKAGSNPRSIARRIATLRNFYGFLLREGLIESDPSERAKLHIPLNTREHAQPLYWQAAG